MFNFDLLNTMVKPILILLVVLISHVSVSYTRQLAAGGLIKAVEIAPVECEIQGFTALLPDEFNKSPR